MESFCYAQETKAVFISIRYPKTPQTQDVKSQSTKRSLRELVQPKRDSAFEQKHVLFQVERSEEILKTICLSYNHRKKQSRIQKDISGTYPTSFWKLGAFLLVRSPFIFRKVCTKIFKTIAYNTKRQRPRFRKYQKLFINNRYRKTSQTQDVRSQSTRLSVRKLAQPKRDSAFEHETRIVSSGEI